MGSLVIYKVSYLLRRNWRGPSYLLILCECKVLNTLKVKVGAELQIAWTLNAFQQTNAFECISTNKSINKG